MLNKPPYRKFSATKGTEAVSSPEGSLFVRCGSLLGRVGPGNFVFRGITNLLGVRGNGIFREIGRRFSSAVGAVGK